jgi:hypothetical protein
MSENHPTTTDQSVKPAKPRPDLPLPAHSAGYWCKKIRGKMHHFGQDQTARVGWLRSRDAATGAERYTCEYRVPDSWIPMTWRLPSSSAFTPAIGRDLQIL